MDYIGSKQKINQWIFNIIENRIPKTEFENYTFIDGCSGSGAVSKYALQMGFNLISNDIMSFPSIIVKGYSISPNKKIITKIYIDEINQLKGIEGFFYNNYSKNTGKLYFTNENAKRIDACRQFIKNIKDKEIKNYLLYCGLEALSAVSNTTGVQAAFLKEYKERALHQFNLKEQKTIDKEINTTIQTYCNNIVDFLKSNQINGKNILYLDPPYNSRQYPSNYHLYETFVKYDNPELIGLTGLRKNWQLEAKSEMCNKNGFLNTLKDIILYSSSEYIYISYSSDGLVTQNEIKEYLNNLNIKINFYELLTKRYKADTSDNRKYNKSDLYEWLIEIIKL